MIMRDSSLRRLLLLLSLLCALTTTTHAFQFMKGWKLPTYNPNEEIIQEKFGDKKLAVLTGASSGLGRKTALALLETGEYHVVGAVRDLDKMEAVVEVDGFNLENFTPMYCELNSFDSVRQFCKDLDEFRMGKPVDRLICNAGVYQPSLPYAKWSVDNHEQTMQINYLSHFLMVSECMPMMLDSNDPRVIMVGSVTGNDNTVGGGGVYPIADLHQLDGFKAGFTNPVSMADGYGFIGAKAYKDSKLCLMMMANYLHTKYHRLTGITFNSMYPGCIAESPLFREKREWFRQYFPVFMKYITGGFVSEHEAGQRLFQVVHDPRCSKSGVYWSWNGGPREGRGAGALERDGQISGGGGAGGGWDSIFENDQSAKVLDVDTAFNLFQCSTQITGAKWPDLKAVTSPCPTLKVIGAVTKGMVQREELKRMREMGRPGMTKDGLVIPVESEEETVVVPSTASVVSTPAAAVPPAVATVTYSSRRQNEGRQRRKLSRRKRAVMAADRVVTFTLKHTVGRVARFAGRRLLGEIPETAKTGSYHATPADAAAAAVNAASPPLSSASSPVMAAVVVPPPAAPAKTLEPEDLEASQQLLEEVGEQLFTESKNEQVKEDEATAEALVSDDEDEALFQQIYVEAAVASTAATPATTSVTPASPATAASSSNSTLSSSMNV